MSGACGDAVILRGLAVAALTWNTVLAIARHSGEMGLSPRQP